MVTEAEIWKILEEVCDPEVPVLSIRDLGIVRDVKSAYSATGERAEQHVEVIITPTYSGCPAMNRIEWDIRTALLNAGIKHVKVSFSLSPAWTTDWMSEAGKQKLKAFGIAPPNPTHSVCDIQFFQEEEAIQCPQCNSYNTKMISQFGSTACKSLYRCNECQEPFDYFKCH